MASYSYITQRGVIIPDVEDVLAEVQQEYRDAFNDETLSVTPDTPQGVLITAETIARENFLRNNAAIANQINPNYAGGVFLDSIWALLGGARKPATKTRVLVNLTGVANSLIPSNVQIESTNGDLFKIEGAVNLSAAGTASAYFNAVEFGAIAAIAGTLNTISIGTLGLETVNNPFDGILGTSTESDDLARKRRNLTLASQGSQSLIAISSELYNTEGVSSLVALENYFNAPTLIKDVLMDPHTYYFAVDGGTDEDVANAIFNKKGGGCGYTSGISSTPVTVNIEGQYGAIYPISFDRPDQLQVLVRVFVNANNSTVDIPSAVRKAVLDYARGLLPFKTGLTVGTSVSSYEISGSISIEVPSISVTSLEITLASLINYDTALIPIASWEQAVIFSDSSITVIVS